MLLVVSLLLVALLIYLLGGQIKKYPTAFYIGAAIISVGVFILGFVDMPSWIESYVLGIFAKGSMGTAIFVAVMYAGALPAKSKLTAPLMKIRGELSITAAILVLCHNFTYGQTYFKMLFTSPASLSAQHLAAAIISVVMILIMLPLTVMSFKSVRKKMNAKRWKQIQRTAYAFYGLMYVHIMLINLPYARLGMSRYIINVIVYSIVFIGYAAMRIVKALSVKAKRDNTDTNLKPIIAVICAVALCLVACMTAACFIARQTASEVTESDGDEEWDIVFSEQSVEELTTEAESLTAAEQTTEESQSSSEADTAESSETQESSQQDNEQTVADTQADQSSSQESQTQTTAPTTTFKADGVYTGSADCSGGGVVSAYTVTVSMTVSDDKVTAVTAISTAKGEDKEYFEAANEVIPGEIVANQGTKGIDAVSDATLSSTAIKKAFYEAYKSALRE